MKYVMFKKDFGDGVVHYVPIIFPESVVHADVAMAIKNGNVLPGYTVHSAGFASDIHVRCKGESVSIGCKSDPIDDTRRIVTNDAFGGLVLQ